MMAMFWLMLSLVKKYLQTIKEIACISWIESDKKRWKNTYNVSTFFFRETVIETIGRFDEETNKLIGRVSSIRRYI